MSTQDLPLHHPLQDENAASLGMCRRKIQQTKEKTYELADLFTTTKKSKKDNLYPTKGRLNVAKQSKEKVPVCVLQH